MLNVTVRGVSLLHPSINAQYIDVCVKVEQKYKESINLQIKIYTVLPQINSKEINKKAVTGF